MTGEFDPLRSEAQDSGNCHGPCQEALAHLDEFVDGEIGPEQHSQIAAHLRSCPPCQAQYSLEAVIKSLVARSCVEQAPPALRARVVAQLISARIRIIRSP